MKKWIEKIGTLLFVYIFSVAMVAIYGFEAYMVTMMSVLITWGLLNDKN